jgi:hypothetical protein
LSWADDRGVEAVDRGVAVDPMSWRQAAMPWGPSTVVWRPTAARDPRWRSAGAQAEIVALRRSMQSDCANRRRSAITPTVAHPQRSEQGPGRVKIATIMELASPNCVDHDVNFMIARILGAVGWGIDIPM